MSDTHGFLGSDDLVTGEAVALDLPAATVAVRVASGLVDVLAQGVLLALGLRTVRDDAGPIGFRHAVIRAWGVSWRSGSSPGSPRWSVPWSTAREAAE